FLDFVLSRGQLHISTIHGVLQIFLKQYGYLINLDPGFRMTSTQETQRSAGRLMKSVICQNKNDVLENFDFKTVLQGAIKYYEFYSMDPTFRAPKVDDFVKTMDLVFKRITESVDLLTSEIERETTDPKYLNFSQYLKGLKASLTTLAWKENCDDVLSSI